MPVKGTLGNLTFTKSKDGDGVKRKGGIDASRIANDPNFQRIRENGAEFGRAGKAGKVLRTAFRSLIQNVADGRMVSRLTKEMMRVIKSDLTSPRGFRNVTDGEAALLKGFEFNANSQLGTTLFAEFTSSINRATGELSVNIPSFLPINDVTAPKGATHYKIVSAGAEIDFESGTSVVDTKTAGELPLDANPTAVINLVNVLPAGSTKALVLVVGIEFFQEVNGVKYTLRNGGFSSLKIVDVSNE